MISTHLPPSEPTTSDEELHWKDTLSDGTQVIVRPIRADDEALEREFIKRLSPESRRLRFLGQVSERDDNLIRNLTRIDYTRDMAFIAIVHRDGVKQEIGVSRYGVSADGTSCECAVTVDEAWRNKGLGTLLMRHLIEFARKRGIRSMVSMDLANNEPMRELADHLGFTRSPDPGSSSQVMHTLQLQAAPT